MISCSVVRLDACACGRLGNRACGKKGNCPFALLGNWSLGGASGERVRPAPRGMHHHWVGSEQGPEIDFGLAFPLG